MSQKQAASLVLLIIIGAITALPLLFLLAIKSWWGAFSYSVIIWAIYTVSAGFGKDIESRFPPRQQPTEPTAPQDPQATRTANRAATLAAMRKR